MWRSTHGPLAVVADILAAVAPIVPQPYDKAITAIAQLCRVLAELTK
jgi:hypothetical protein